jgi:hypothetical protein
VAIYRAMESERPDEQVSGLARDLHAQEEIRWWLIDLASPMLLEMLARRCGPDRRPFNAPGFIQ